MSLEAVLPQPALPAGLAVFVDDDQPLVRTEKEIAERAGLEVRSIDVRPGLEAVVAEVFSYAKTNHIPTQRIIFFIDNRMRDFWKAVSADENGDSHKVVSLEQYRNRMGNHGKYAGMAIAEWLVAAHGKSNPGFHLAILSGYSDEGITRRVQLLKDRYPYFLGFLSKIVSEGDKSSTEAEKIRFFRDVISRVVVQDIRPSGIPNLPTDYPYGHVLLSVIQELELDPDEVMGFLRLSYGALPKIDVLRDDPTKFELDTRDWQEKAFLVWELLIMLEHDFGDFEKVLLWINSPHVLLNGITPRELIASGLIAEIDTLRTIVRYGS